MSAGLDHTGPAGVGHGGPVEARDMLARLAARRTAAGQQLPVRHALDAGLLLRPPDRERPGRRRGPRWACPSSPAPRRSAGRCSTSPASTSRAGAARRRSGPHGHKLGVQGIPGDVPQAVPLLAVRIGSRVIVSYPGESTKEVGARLRAAVGAAVAGSGVQPGGGLRPGQRVHPLLHDARGARPPALRGRPDPVRPLVLDPRQRGVGRRWPAGWCAGCPPRPPSRSTPPTACGPTARPTRRARRRARALEQPAGRGAALRPGRVRLAGRPAGPRPAGGQRVRDRPAAHPAARAPAGDLAQRSRRPRLGDALDRRRRRPLPGGLGELLLRQARAAPVRGDREALPADLASRSGWGPATR